MSPKGLLRLKSAGALNARADPTAQGSKAERARKMQRPGLSGAAGAKRPCGCAQRKGFRGGGIQGSLVMRVHGPDAAACSRMIAGSYQAHWYCGCTMLMRPRPPSTSTSR